MKDLENTIQKIKTENGLLSENKKGYEDKICCLTEEIERLKFTQTNYEKIIGEVEDQLNQTKVSLRLETNMKCQLIQEKHELQRSLVEMKENNGRVEQNHFQGNDNFSQNVNNTKKNLEMVEYASINNKPANDVSKFIQEIQSLKIQLALDENLIQNLQKEIFVLNQNKANSNVSNLNDKMNEHENKLRNYEEKIKELMNTYSQNIFPDIVSHFKLLSINILAIFNI